MRNYTLFVWVGVWLFVLPFLGLPGNWKDRLLILTSIVVFVYAFFEYRRVGMVGEAEGETGVVAEEAGDTPSSKSENTQ